MKAGRVHRVSGPVLEVEGLTPEMLELVEVGEARLPGEVIALHNGRATVQVYAYTGGVRPGDVVTATGHPLRATLGPGLLGGIFDGMLRRLSGAAVLLGDGERPGTLDEVRRWAFTPVVSAGDEVTEGAVLGEVGETAAIVFRALVPPGVGGTLEWIAPEGEVTVVEPIARVGGTEVRLATAWPVRRARPVAERVRADVPLRTGQRALDLFFPVTRGGSAAVPGGFGTGKTVLLQQIAKWCDADVIVYVGCGERGNEMADVLEEIAGLEDPRTGRLLLDRTVLVANTSNMPVLAREASIYTGVTVAELYRDMGYDAVLIADSTSRWAEALREVSSRTGELPAEEGYPAGLASALAAFYERSGRVRTLAGADASVTIVGAVSPPGGDMTEPVGAHTRRFVRCVWSLDADLAYARHYPAVSWSDSSSRDVERVAEWHATSHDPQWAARREHALRLLSDADRLESIAQLVGAGSLPDRERVTMLAGRLLREGVLQQSSLSANDAYCPPGKQQALLELVLDVYERCRALVEGGAPAARVEELDLSAVTRARETAAPDDPEAVAEIAARVLASLGELE
ncbi:MAG: V-type ATP synthase subunit A [Gaiella sp.]|nr:V-type ATP synthase subunit A [Gaiella sp.]